MCTLSFIPNNKGTSDFIVTSNRDESAGRGTIPPKTYLEMGVEMLYPKDEVAGGTWIGASSKNRLVCLMNGAFEPHQRKKTYRMSRGVVVKKLLSAETTIDFMDHFDFQGIEPFTIVAVDWSTKPLLWQLVWDGTKKHVAELPVRPYIWSASMLYSEEIKKEREHIFKEFLRKNTSKKLTGGMLLDFHQQFKINRKYVKTTSITQFEHKNGETNMRYFPLDE